MDLVFLPFEPAEEALDPLEAGAVAIDDEPLLVLGEIHPRHIEPDPAARGALQLGELRTVVRLAPGLDGVLLNRLRRVGHDQRHVQLDDVAEPMAERTGAERIVEREQPRLRHLVRDVALRGIRTAR